MVVAIVALVGAFGGSAIADQAADLARRAKLINGREIKPRTIRGNRLKRDTLTGKEINESKLAVVPNANKANSATTARTADSVRTADNAKTAENAKAVNGVTESQFTVGRSASGSCNPTSATVVDCASVTFSLPGTGRVLVTADSTWHSESSTATRGSCEVAVDGSDLSGDMLPGQLSVDTDSTHQQSIGANLITAPVSNGSHTFALRCNELQGNIVFDQAFISALMIGSA